MLRTGFAGVGALVIACLALVAAGPGGLGVGHATGVTHATRAASASWFLVFSSRKNGGDTDLYGASADGRHVVSLTRNNVDDDLADVSRTGRLIAFSQAPRSKVGHYKTVVLDASGKTVRTVPAASPQGFSPDDRWLLLDRDSYVGSEYRNSWLEAAPLRGGRAKRLGVAGEQSEGFSPNGRRLAIWNNHSESIKLVDFRTSKPIVAVVPEGNHPGWAVWSPDSEQVTYDDASGLRLLGAHKGATPRTLLPRITFDYSWLDKTHLGYDALATDSPEDESEEIGTIDTVSGSTSAIARGDITLPLGAAWSPDHRTVAYLANQSSEQPTLVVVRFEATGARVLAREASGSFCAVSWSPSGRFLALPSPDEKLIILDTRTGNRFRTTFEWHLSGSSWSPDDHHLAVSANGTIVIIDPASRSIRRLPPQRTAEAVGWMRGKLPKPSGGH